VAAWFLLDDDSDSTMILGAIVSIHD